MKGVIISSSVLILTVILLRHLLSGKISLKLRYMMWLLVAIRLLIPFEMGQSSFSVMTLVERVESSAAVYENYDTPDDTPNFEDVQTPANPPAIIPVTPQDPTQSPVKQNSVTIIDILKIIYVAGALSMAGWILFVNLRFTHEAKKNAVPLKGTVSPLPVYITDGIPSPCLLGYFRPAVYLTPHCTNEPALTHVLAHELTHWRNHDVFWSAVRSLCLCLHWFNPLVWWAASLSKHDCELACDEGALTHLREEDRLAYGRTLVDMTVVSSAPAFLLQTATTMADRAKGIRERVRVIVKQPKNLALAVLSLILSLAVAVGCTFTGAKADESDNAQQPSEVVSDSTEAADPSLFKTEVDPEKFCLAVSPTGISMAGGDYRYLIPEEQDAFQSAYDKALAAMDENGNWQVDDSYYGFWLLWGEEWWQFTRTGEAVRLGGGRVKGEAAAELFELCLAECREANVGDNVRPEDIVGITKATLQVGSAVSTVTDRATLAKIEELLTSGEELRGGAACPFTALLTLERENGDPIVISHATDSCGVWMSEGVCYNYPGDNLEFFALFPPVIDSTLTQFIANLKGSDIYTIGWYVGDNYPSPYYLAELLNAAAENITEEADTRVDTAKIEGIWNLDFSINMLGADTVLLSAGLEENIVEIWTLGHNLPDGRIWVEDEALYQFLRTMNDGPEGIDTTIEADSYNKYEASIDAFIGKPMPHEMEGVTATRQLTSFTKAASKPAIGAELYTIGYVINIEPKEKAPYYLAGGAYVDSQLRVHWDGSESNILVVIDGEAVGFMNPMSVYIDGVFDTCETREDLLKACDMRIVDLQ